MIEAELIDGLIQIISERQAKNLIVKVDLEGMLYVFCLTFYPCDINIQEIYLVIIYRLTINILWLYDEDFNIENKQ